MAHGLIPMFSYWSMKNPYFTMLRKEDRIAVFKAFEQNL